MPEDIQNQIINCNAATSKEGGIRKILLELKVIRDPKGLKIHLRSDTDWSSFGFTPNEHGIIKIGKIECLYPKQSEVEGVTGYFCSDNIFEYHGFPNMAMLLALDIRNGVKFDFGPFPISENKVKDWMNKLKVQAKIIFNTFLKELNISTIITTETVEKEIIN